MHEYCNIGIHVQHVSCTSKYLHRLTHLRYNIQLALTYIFTAVLSHRLSLWRGTTAYLV